MSENSIELIKNILAIQEQSIAGLCKEVAEIKELVNAVHDMVYDYINKPVEVIPKESVPISTYHAGVKSTILDDLVDANLDAGILNISADFKLIKNKVFTDLWGQYNTIMVNHGYKWSKGVGWILEEDEPSKPSSDEPPTEKQLDLLSKLGIKNFKGNKREASQQIDAKLKKK